MLTMIFTPKKMFYTSAPLLNLNSGSIPEDRPHLFLENTPTCICTEFVHNKMTKF